MITRCFQYFVVIILAATLIVLPVPASFATEQTILPEPVPEFSISPFPFPFPPSSGTGTIEPTIIPMCINRVSGFIPLQSFGATTCPAQYLAVILITNPFSTAFTFSGSTSSNVNSLPPGNNLCTYGISYIGYPRLILYECLQLPA